jgi:hypothetical protein
LSLRSSSYIQLRHKYATARVAEFPEARGVMLRILFTHTHRVVIASTTIQVTTAAPCEAHMTQRIAVGARDRLRSCRPTAPCSRRREGRQREQQSDHRHVPKSPHELGHGSILSAVVPLIAQNARQSAATTLADGAPVPSLAAGPGEHAAPGSGRRRERRQREQQSGGKQLPQHRDLPCRPMLPTTRGAVVVCHADARAACPQAARFPFACTFDWCIETTFTRPVRILLVQTLKRRTPGSRRWCEGREREHQTRGEQFLEHGASLVGFHAPNLPGAGQGRVKRTARPCRARARPLRTHRTHTPLRGRNSLLEIRITPRCGAIVAQPASLVPATPRTRKDGMPCRAEERTQSGSRAKLPSTCLTRPVCVRHTAPAGVSACRNWGGKVPRLRERDSRQTGWTPAS